MNNDALDNIKRLRDALNEAIAAMEAGREVKVEEKLPCDEQWNEVNVFRDRDYRCVVRPREVWVNDYRGDKWRMLRTREEADKRAIRDIIRWIRFVEDQQEENQ